MFLMKGRHIERIEGLSRIVVQFTKGAGKQIVRRGEWVSESIFAINCGRLLGAIS
jgi:hypothetical protein